jgi:hypothetical protein
MADIDRVYGIKRLFFNRLKIGDPYEFSKGGTPHDFICYGCDEGRNGYLIHVRRKLSDGVIIKEEACHY